MNRHVHHVRGLLVGLAVLAGALPALADTSADIELSGVSDDCGGATLQPISGEGLSLQFPSFVAETSETTRQVRKLCSVRLKFNVPENLCVLRDSFEVFGSAKIARGAPHANVSVRYFGPGDTGADYYRSIDFTTGPEDITARSQGPAQWISCDNELFLNLLIDVTVRSAADDPAKMSSVKITEVKVPKAFYRR